MSAFVDLTISSVPDDFHQVENSGRVLELGQVDVVEGRTPSHRVGHLQSRVKDESNDTLGVVRPGMVTNSILLHIFFLLHC